MDTAPIVKTSSTLLLIAALAGINFFTAKLGLSLTYVEGNVSLLWPPTGISLAAVLLGGLRLSPGVFLGSFLVNLWLGSSLVVAASMGVGATLEAVVGALLLRRVAGFPNAFDRQRDVFFFLVFGVLCGTAISASIGVSALFLGATKPLGAYTITWLTWWAGNAAGAIIVAPVILACWREKLPAWRMTARVTEGAVLCVSVVTVSAIVFGDFVPWPDPRYPLAYLPFPLLAWAALRFGARGASLSSLAICTIAVWGSVTGTGPFFIQDNVNSSLLLVWGYISVTAFTALLMTAILGERRRAEEEIHKLNEDLEQRVAERTAELRESEERLKEAERVALMGHWLFDVGTGAEIRSDQDVRNYGLEPGQMAPTFEAFLQAVHPDDRDMVKARVEKALSTLEPFHYEFRSLWPDGQVRTILTKCQMALDDDGNLVGMLGVNQDITERKRLESELLGRERLATLGQLTATVGHELRNPLGAIRTSMYIVEKVADIKDDRFTRSVERIKRSVTRCDNIIDELLDFTRVQGLEPAKTGLDRWLGTLLDELEVPESVEVKRKFGAPDTVVMADVDRFRRAVINVFNNGCQAMIGEGREDTGSEESNLTVRTQERDGRIEVILEDTGPGIPPDVYERIFEPLYSTKGFGVGLGLPVVKQIMEQHGGGIEIESEEGRGTRVCLWLPNSHSTQ